MSSENIMSLVLYSLPLAFGVVIIILSLLTFLGVGDPVDNSTLFPLIGLGMLCLGMAGLNNLQENDS